MTWEEKAEFIRLHGHSLRIESCPENDSSGYRWSATLDNQSKVFNDTIGEVIDELYESVLYRLNFYSVSRSDIERLIQSQIDLATDLYETTVADITELRDIYLKEFTNEPA